MLTQRVADLMRPCQTTVISVTTRLRQAAEILIDSDNPLLIAVDEHGHFAGIVAESAVVRALLATTSADATLERIVSRHVASAREDACLNSVLPLFRDACHTVVPVVNEHVAVVGLLHRRDIVRLLLSDSADGTNTVVEDRASGTPMPHFRQVDSRRKANNDPSDRESA